MRSRIQLVYTMYSRNNESIYKSHMYSLYYAACNMTWSQQYTSFGIYYTQTKIYWEKKFFFKVSFIISKFKYLPSPHPRHHLQPNQVCWRDLRCIPIDCKHIASFGFIIMKWMTFLASGRASFCKKQFIARFPAETARARHIQFSIITHI